MRHRKSGRKLKRTASHRKALLASLTTSLLRHKRIQTTLAKAKETRMVVEKLITRARHAAAKPEGAANVHHRRMVARMIKDRGVVSELFGDIAAKTASRAGGYTRIVKLGRRPGDNAEVAIIELVDYQLTPGAKPEAGGEAKEAGKEKKAGKKKSEGAEAASRKSKAQAKV